MEFGESFNNKRVLITGDTGFKGTWLSIWLKKMGADVLGYALDPPSETNMFEAVRLTDEINHIHGNIIDSSYLFSVLKDYQPEFVFHLAAQSLVKRSYNEPVLTYETNVIGTVNVFEAIRQINSVKAIINVTSDKCYENKEWVWGYRENDALGGYDPYSSSKACAELVTQSYTSSFFNDNRVGIASVRAGNVIGGGEWGKDRIVPDCMRALSSQKVIPIRNPNSCRPWQFILEPLRGYLMLAERLYVDGGEFQGPWNFGPTSTKAVKTGELVKNIIASWGQGTWQDVSSNDESDKHEMRMLRLNSDKANMLLGWRDVMDIDLAVKMSVQWYKKYYDNNSKGMYEFTSDQIDEYMKLVSKVQDGIE